MRRKLQELEDPRRTSKGNIRHKLEDIIIIGLCSLICNGDDFSDMEDFGEARQAWLQQFLELPLEFQITILLFSKPKLALSLI